MGGGAGRPRGQVLQPMEVDDVWHGARILSVCITSLLCPNDGPLGGLSLDDVYTMFSSAGAVEKIMCLPCPETGPPFTHVDILIQLESPDIAQHIVDTWSGHSITGSQHNIMSVEYAQQTDLDLPPDSELCRDYTHGAAANTATTGMEMTPYGGSDGAKTAPDAATATGCVAQVRVENLKSPLVSPLAGLTIDRFFDVFQHCGAIEKIVCNPGPKMPPFAYVDALIQFAEISSVNASIQQLSGLNLTDDEYHYMQVWQPPVEELRLGPDSYRSRDYTASAGGVPAMQPLGSAKQGMSRVVGVHITALGRPHVQPLGGLTIEAIHAAFSVFGSVDKVSCTANPAPGGGYASIDALVQFSMPHVAASAVSLMDGKSLTGNMYNLLQTSDVGLQDILVGSDPTCSRDFSAQRLAQMPGAFGSWQGAL